MQRLGNGSLPVFPSAEEPQGGETVLRCCPCNLSFFSRNFRVNTPLIHGSKLREGHRAYSLLLLRILSLLLRMWFVLPVEVCHCFKGEKNDSFPSALCPRAAGCCLPWYGSVQAAQRGFWFHQNSPWMAVNSCRGTGLADGWWKQPHVCLLS